MAAICFGFFFELFTGHSHQKYYAEEKFLNL